MLIKHKIIDKIRHYCPRSKVIIQGSYETLNIGDLAIGQVLRQYIKDSDITGWYYPFQNFSKYDCHIIGGGGIFHDNKLGNMEKRLRAFGTAKKNVVLGIGVPGFKMSLSKHLIKKIENADLITVRDVASKQELGKYISKEILVTACPAFLMQPTPQIKTVRNRIGISLRRWNTYLFVPHYINHVLRIFKDLSKDNELFYIPHDRYDYDFANKYLANLNIVPLSSPQLTLDFVQSCEKMISMRYHSLIFSIIAEKPLYVINYASKTNEIVEEWNLPNYDMRSMKPNVEFEFCDRDHVKIIKHEMIRRAKMNFKHYNNFQKMVYTI